METNETIEQRARGILDILIEARGIHPLFAVNLTTMAKKLYDPEYSKEYERHPDYPSYYVSKYHQRIWRAIPKVLELGNQEGLQVSWIRKPTKKDPNRFGRITGYRILLPDENPASMLSERIFILQSNLNFYHTHFEQMETMVGRFGTREELQESFAKAPGFDETIKMSYNLLDMIMAGKIKFPLKEKYDRWGDYMEVYNTKKKLRVELLNYYNSLTHKVQIL